MRTDRETDKRIEKKTKWEREKRKSKREKKKCVKTEKGNGKKIKIKAEICEEHSTQK